jgi:preprotein translocase subunit SecE
MSAQQEAMNDLIFVLITLAFFALAAAYAGFCEKVR